MTEESRKRLEKQIQFILEIDNEKNIFRQTSLTGRIRKENDAEHAWHMAIMTYLLREYANEPFDLAHTMMMCLIHDIVEIDAGDTYAYDEENKKSQKEREEKAAERIFSLLPQDQKKEIYDLFEEFEANETAEARFAHAMDNFQPLLLNDSNDGGDWQEHQVSRKQVDGRQSGSLAGSKIIYEKTKEILDKHDAAGHFRKEEEDQKGK